MVSPRMGHNARGRSTDDARATHRRLHFFLVFVVDLVHGQPMGHSCPWAPDERITDHPQMPHVSTTRTLSQVRPVDSPHTAPHYGRTTHAPWARSGHPMGSPHGHLLGCPPTYHACPTGHPANNPRAPPRRSHGIYHRASHGLSHGMSYGTSQGISRAHHGTFHGVTYGAPRPYPRAYILSDPCVNMLPMGNRWDSLWGESSGAT